MATKFDEETYRNMGLQLGDAVPDFTQDSTDGQINFHDYIDGGWAILFSHPKDFTPVCTTELGRVSRLKSEFEKRGVKVIGLSCDTVESHKRWLQDIEDTQGIALNFPLIGDADRGHAPPSEAVGITPFLSSTAAELRSSG